MPRTTTRKPPTLPEIDPEETPTPAAEDPPTPPANEEPAELGDEAPPDSDLESFLIEQGEGADVTCTVYRFVNPGRRQAFVMTCSGWEFSRERLRDDFGGGDFRIYIKRNKKLVATKSLLVEPPRRVTPPPAPPAPAPIAPELVQTLNAMQAAIAQLAQMSQRPAVDTEEALLRKLAMFKELLGGAPQPAPALDPMKQFEVFKQGIELAKSFASESGEKSNIDVLLESIRTFGKPLAAIVARGIAASSSTPTPATPKAPAQPQQPKLTTPATPVQPTNPQPKVNDMGPMREMLAQQFNWLCDQAGAGGDPLLYGDLVLEQVPEEHLREFVTSGDPYKKMLEIQPRVGLYGDWFRELIQHVTNELNAEIEDETGQNVPATNNNANNDDAS